MNLNDRTILITGASAGIGLAFALKFTELGNEVIVTGRRRTVLDEVTGIQIESVEFFQFPDAPQTALAEGALSIKDVQNDALHEVAESEIVVIGKGPQHFQEPLFHADARLHTLDRVFFIPGHHRYQCTKLLRYKKK